MASYLSSLLTSTTSRYTDLRRSLLSSEQDGDTEIDSHISRVLRAYYDEKGRPLPDWLPPDSKRAQQSQSQPLYPQPQRPSAQPLPSRRGGGLSDLWDSPSPASSQSQSSLRTTRRYDLPSSGRPEPLNSPGFQRPSGARPLLGQMDAADRHSAPAGGSASSGRSNPMAGSAGGGGTAQDKLKARLWGAGKTTAFKEAYGGRHGGLDLMAGTDPFVRGCVRAGDAGGHMSSLAPSGCSKQSFRAATTLPVPSHAYLHGPILVPVDCRALYDDNAQTRMTQ